MNITRYTQSCMLVEINQTRILIDPGDDFAEVHDISELGKITAVLYTHEHADHFNKDIYDYFSAQNVKCYANQSLATQYESLEIITSEKNFEILNVEVKPLDLPHCLMPNGSEGPQNTGYLINDTFFHPGDGIYLEGIQSDILALPVTGPDISMLDAFRFAKQVKAKKVIPIHYDRIGANPDVYAFFAKRINEPYDFVVLNDGETVEL